MNQLLALDIATKTGFCTANASGVWDLSPKRDESKGMRLIRFKSKLKDICSVEDIKVIVFERVAGFHKSAIIVAAELHGVMKTFCEENGIEYRGYSASEIKKYATGKGNAKKDAILKAAQVHKPSIQTDDEADAYFLYLLAVQDLGIS